jgi:SAM-dependent methyltransferase
MAHNHPGSRLLHLTNGKNAKNQNLLPTTVTQTLVDLNGNGGRSEFLLPYVNESMDMIYMSRPAILLPASQIPNLLRDCYRILKPGGAVKLRLIDAMPDQQSAGPDLSEWIDTHLLETLEQESRISQPSLRVPIWAKLAGFVVPEIPEKTICLPGVISCDEEATTVIGAKVAQDIWKASWGMFVRQGNSYCQTFWWEEPEIVQECITLGTTWTITTLLLTKIRR